METLGGHPKKGRFFVACSGGVDSMCLALLTRDWLRGFGDSAENKLQALIVDHQLRPTSTDEANKTRNILQQQGISAHILTWRHDQVVSGLEQKARTARYKLINEHITAVTKEGEPALLLTGHHLDDQTETFLMRLETGSKLKGLAGISSKAHMVGHDAVLLRPLLAFSKDQLAATLTAYQVDFVPDPSNQETKLKRNWLRAHEASLSEAGLARADINSVQHTLGRVRRWTDKFAVNFIETEVNLNTLGYAEVPLQKLRQLPSELQEEVLLRLVNWLRPATVKPVISIANISILVGQGGANSGIRTKISGAWLYIFVWQIDAADLGSLPQEIDVSIADADVTILGKKRSQQFRVQINPNLPSYLLASMPVIQASDSPDKFCMPQFEFHSDSMSNSEFSNILSHTSQYFGHISKTQLSNHIFTVVSG